MSSSHVIPDYSIDWRFLLPSGPEIRMLVVGCEQSDFEKSFRELTFPVKVVSVGELHDLVEEGKQFDSVAAPVGLLGDKPYSEPGGWLANCHEVKRLIRPGGVLLIGFSNRWGIRSKLHISHKSSMQEVQKSLKALGFQKLHFYGALPASPAPEYIFPLDARFLGYVLNKRYQHKLPKLFLSLVKTSFAQLILKFLPYYYIVAQLVERP